jgi:hypothetical protein
MKFRIWSGGKLKDKITAKVKIYLSFAFYYCSFLALTNFKNIMTV